MKYTVLIVTMLFPLIGSAAIPTLDLVPVGTALNIQQDLTVAPHKLDLLFQRGEAIENPRDQYDNVMGCWVTLKRTSTVSRTFPAGTNLTIHHVESETKFRKMLYSFAVNHEDIQSIDCWKSISNSDAWTPMTTFDFAWTFGDYLSELPEIE